MVQILIILTANSLTLSRIKVTVIIKIISKEKPMNMRIPTTRCSRTLTAMAVSTTLRPMKRIIMADGDKTATQEWLLTSKHDRPILE